MSHKSIEELNAEIELLRRQNIELELANCELYCNIADLQIQLIDSQTAVKHLDLEAQDWINAKIASLSQLTPVFR